jgi:hypothetical protein
MTTALTYKQFRDLLNDLIANDLVDCDWRLRNPVDIRRVREEMGNRPELIEWQADSFKFGFLLGKSIALDWVCGEYGSFFVSADIDYQDFCRLQKEAGDDFKRGFGDDTSK